MKDTKIIMGMPITVEINGAAKRKDLNEVFDYFRSVDKRYSPYKASSEVSRYNAGTPIEKTSEEFKFVLGLCEDTKRKTKGRFDIKRADGTIDPSGLVKGWSIQNAVNLLCLRGWRDFYVEAGGDVFAAGDNQEGEKWKLGIRNPFNTQEVIKVLAIGDCGVATSGNYIRGNHIYDPLHEYKKPSGVSSLTVIGSNVYDADRYATAAFAMGEAGIGFIDNLEGFEGYMVNDHGLATMTRGFEAYVA